MAAPDVRIVTVFRSRLREGAGEEYRTLAGRIETLARAQPGFVDAKSFAADDGERVTVVVFSSHEAQRAWRDHPEHRAAQAVGRERLYASYSVEVAESVTRATFEADRPPAVEERPGS